MEEQREVNNGRLAFEAFVVLNSQGLQKPHYTMCMKKRDSACQFHMQRNVRGWCPGTNTVCIIMVIILDLYNLCEVTQKWKPLSEK